MIYEKTRKEVIGDDACTEHDNERGKYAGVCR